MTLTTDTLTVMVSVSVLFYAYKQLNVFYFIEVMNMGAQTRKPLLDHEWAGRAFLAPKSSLTDEADEFRRYFTTSSRKFVSSAIGGHFCINPIPQFTANADIAHPAFFTKGLDVPSRWWSEKLDDYAQYIHIRPGVPRFNSLTSFFGNFYNVHMGAVARTGQAPSAWFSIGEAVGVIGTLPLKPFIWGGSVLKFFLQTPRSKFYYLHPTPYPYRFAVQTIMNAIMANMGMIIDTPSNDDLASGLYENSDPRSTLPSNADRDTVTRVYGDLKRFKYINDVGGIDVFAISTSATKLANDFRTKMEDAILNATSSISGVDAGPDAIRIRQDAIGRILHKQVNETLKSLTISPVTTAEYTEKYREYSDRTKITDDWTTASLTMPAPETEEEMKKDDSLWGGFTSYISDVWNHMKDEMDRGADFVTFRVNWTGSQSESFGNQAGESSLATQVNSMSAKARDIRFSMADGNVTDGIVGKTVGLAAQAAKDLISGTLEGFSMGGAIALMGNAFADIQRVYQSSSADLNRTTFTMHLRTWSADDFGKIQNVFLPLAHIMALGMPRATGPGSYDGPFLVEVYNQGKTLIREGMVESINITRGVGDVGFDNRMGLLNIDVDVTIVDLSSIMSVPIATGVSAMTATAGAAMNTVHSMVGGDGTGGDTIMGAINPNTYSEDNKFTDYMATITSLPLDVLVEPRRKWRLRMARMRSDMASHRTAANLGSSIMDLKFMPSETLKMLFSDMGPRR